MSIVNYSANIGDGRTRFLIKIYICLCTFWKSLNGATQPNLRPFSGGDTRSPLVSDGCGKQSRHSFAKLQWGGDRMTKSYDAAGSCGAAAQRADPPPPHCNLSWVFLLVTIQQILDKDPRLLN